MFLIFLHQLDRNVGALLQPCERFAQDRASAGLKTLIVYLAADKIEAERRMRAVIGSLRLESLVGVSLDGLEGPGAYGLNKEVAVTAMVAKDKKVTANFAIVQPGMVDAPKIMAAVAQHVGGRVLTAEELQAERARARPAGGNGAGQDHGKHGRCGRPARIGRFAAWSDSTAEYAATTSTRPRAGCAPGPALTRRGGLSWPRN